MQKIIKHLLENLLIEPDDIAHFPKDKYNPFKIGKEKFFDIIKKESKKKIVFIDGGNQEIIGSFNFSLQLIKVFYCIFENNKNVAKKLIEAYALINVKRTNNCLRYNSKLFFRNDKILAKDFNFDLYDKTLKTGNRKASISSIADTTRKNMEIIIAKKICKELKDGILVLDRNLEAASTGEDILLSNLYKEAKINNNIISGITKTSSILTESGNSLIALLENIGPKNKAWYYYPLVKIINPKHQAEIFISKFHPRSEYIFRFEIYKESNYNINEILSIISENSKDPVFLGYPYGMIVADKFARVSNKEIEMQKTKFMVRMGKDFNKIKSYINTKNAHNILDNIG